MLWLLLSLILAIALAWHRAGLRTTTAAFAVLLLAFAVFGGSPVIFGLLLLIFAGVFVPLSLPTLRQEWLTRPILDAVQRRLLPTRAASLGLESAEPGDGADGEWDRRLLSERARDPLTPTTVIDAAPQALIAALAPSLDRSPQDTLNNLAAQRAFALGLPSVDGGLELSAAQRSLLLQALGSLSPASKLPDWLASFDAAAQIVALHATAAQQTALLPAMADGSLRAVLATRSYWATGDSLPDRAVVCRGLWKGKEMTGLLTNFDKLVEPAATLASEYLMSLQLSDPENLLGPASASGPSLVRLPAMLAEVRFDAAGDTARVQGRDRFVPLDYLIGGPAAIGRLSVLLQSAAAVRAMGQVAVASGRAAQRFETLRLRSRVNAFHRLQAAPRSTVQSALSQAALDAYGLDTLRRLLARQLAPSASDAPASPRVAALGLELASRLSGNSGDSVTPDELALDSLVGLLCPVLSQSLRAAATQPYGMALLRFDETLWPLVGELVAHQSHSLLLALSDGRLAGNGIGGRHAQRLARYRAALACCCDAYVIDLRPAVHGGLADTRLREALAQTLGLAAALQAHVDDGQPRDQMPLLDAYAARCARRIEAALEAFIQQQTPRGRRLWLRLLLLPLGQQATPVEAAATRFNALLQTGAVRERLRRALTSDDATAAAELEQSLDAAADAQQRLLQALDNGRITPAAPLVQIGEALQLNVITAIEADALRTALNLSEDWLASDRDQNVHFNRSP